MKALRIGLSCIALILVLLSFIPVAGAAGESPAYDSMSAYSHMKAHTITGTPGENLYDYQLKYIIHRGGGTDSGQDVYLGGQSLSWPYDFRFANGTDYPLSYWIESYDADTATVWVEVDYLIAAPSTSEIRLYYGKAGDSGASDGDATFLLFDDFSGGFDTAKWTQVLGPGAYVAQQDGELNFYGTGSDSGRPLVRSNAQFGRGIMITAIERAYSLDSIGGLSLCWDGDIGGRWNSPESAYSLELSPPSADVKLLATMNGEFTQLDNRSIISDTTWHMVSFGIDDSGNIRAWLDDKLVIAAWNTSYADGYVGMYGREQPPGVRSGFKNVYVRQYTLHEPRYGQWVSEQQLTATPEAVPPQEPLSGYSYVKTHLVDGSTDSPLADYPVRFSVHRGSGEDHGANVYLDGRSQRWPDDIRFTDIGDRPLSYWVESANDSTALVWVKVPYIPSYPGAASIKLYYGNVSATSASNGQDTWEFFDDFGSLDSSRWSVVQGTPSVEGGTITCRASETDCSVKSSDKVSVTDKRVLARVMTAHWSNTSYTEVFQAAGAENRSLEADFSNHPEEPKSHTYVNWIHGDPLGYYDIKGWSSGTWHVLNAERLGSQIIWSVDNVNPVDCSRTYWTDPGHIGFYAIRSGAEISVDWVCIGPVTANEPAHGDWSYEQLVTTTATAPVEDISGYAYLKSHELVGSTDGPLMNYPVRLSVHPGSGRDDGENVYLGGHSLCWPYDIRFSDAGGNPLSFWIESSNNSTALVWVKIPGLPAYPDRPTITLYYGNTTATPASDIEGTFRFADDFTTFDNASKWRNNSYVHVEQGTELRISTSLDEGYYTSNPIVTRQSNFSPGEAAIVRLKGNGYTAYYNFDFGYKDDDNRVELQGDYDAPGTHGKTYLNGSSAVTGNLCNNKETYHTYEIRRYPAGDQISYLVDGRDVAVLNSSIYCGDGTIRLGPWVKGSEVIVDWIAVRPLAQHEPAHGGWSAEVNMAPTTQATPTMAPTQQKSPASGPFSFLKGIDTSTMCCLSMLVAVLFVVLLLFVVLALVVLKDLRK